MNKQYIPFESRERVQELPCHVKFSVTTKVYNDIIKYYDRASFFKFMSELSGQGALLFYVHSNKEGTAKDDRTFLYTSNGIFICSFKPKELQDGHDMYENIILTTYFPLNVRERNIAMSKGVVFNCVSNTLVIIKLRESDDFKGYAGCEESDPDLVEDIDCSAATKFIERKLHDIKENVDEYRASKSTDNILNFAETYARLEQSLSTEKADKAGALRYEKIEPCLLEDRETDRQQYYFYVPISTFGDNQKEYYQNGAQVEIEIKTPNRNCYAEIVGVEELQEEVKIKLLLKRQFEYSEFGATGLISPSISTVNFDVQNQAIEKIRNGYAKAKYMNDLLGENKSAGFIDISDIEGEIDQKLNAQKYPPNESQKKAIKDGIAAKDFYMVMGPPGTGKTTVIRQWVDYFVKELHKRVLISSQNNKAVDNVLGGFADSNEIDMLRIGSESKVMQNIVPFIFYNKIDKLQKEIVNNSEINDKILHNYSEKLSGYYGDFLSNYKSLLSDYDHSREKFVNSDKLKDLQGKYNRLHSCIEDKKGFLIELQDKEKQLLKKYERLEKSQSNFWIISQIKKLIYNVNEEQIDNLLESIVSLQEKDRNNIEEYDKTYREYTALREDVKTEFFNLCITPAQQILICLKTAIEEMSPENNENIIRTGKNVCELLKKKYDDFSPDNTDTAILEQEMANEIDRLKKAYEFVSNYSKNVLKHVNYNLGDILLNSVDVVGATCIGVNSQKMFADLDFDVTIIDEAGQIQVHNALVPMSVSNKLIMLGDHKQIPPGVSDEMKKSCNENNVDMDYYECSLFEKLYEKIPGKNKTMLDTQYRMPSEIAITLSEWFYGGKYKSGGNKVGLKSILPWLSNKPYVVIDTSKANNRHEAKPDGEENGAINRLETDIISTLIKRVIEEDSVEKNEIGVISAYKAQVHLIQHKLAEYVGFEASKEMASTLDSYQGQERDLIIFSFTKSSTLPRKVRRIGFLKELRRLNVAMSRCKKMLILIGDMDFLSQCQNTGEPNDFSDEEEITEQPQQTEARFSQFIRKMLSDVRAGNGDLISYERFYSKIEG